MKTVDISYARLHLSQLIAAAARGEDIIITRAGRPVAKLAAINAPGAEMRRTGFLAGHFSVPEDFDRLGQCDIDDMFGRGQSS